MTEDYYTEDYYSDTRGIRRRLARDFPFVTSDSWGGWTVPETDESGEAISAEKFQSLAQVAVTYAVRAETAANGCITRANESTEQLSQAMNIVGTVAKKAAAAQRWCDEYENYVATMCDALNTSGNYDAANILRNAADRRVPFTITLSVMARDSGNAWDVAYSMASNDDVSLHNVERAPVEEESPEESPEESSDDALAALRDRLTGGQ